MESQGPGIDYYDNKLVTRAKLCVIVVISDCSTSFKSACGRDAVFGSSAYTTTESSLLSSMMAFLFLSLNASSEVLADLLASDVINCGLEKALFCLTVAAYDVTSFKGS